MFPQEHGVSEGVQDDLGTELVSIIYVFDIGMKHIYINLKDLIG